MLHIAPYKAKNANAVVTKTCKISLFFTPQEMKES